MVLARLALRNALAHKVRFGLTTLAVVLGVGFVAGSFMVTDSLRDSVEQLFDDISGGVDVSVRAESDLEFSGGSGPGARGRIPGDLVDLIESVDGVEAAEGQVAGYAQLLDADGNPVTSTGAPFIGVSVGDVDELIPATLDQGRQPDGPGEVAIDRGTAEDFGFRVGDRTEVLLADGTHPAVTIVGIFTFGESNNLLGARLTAFDLDVADEVFGTGGDVDTIDVLASAGVDPTELATRVQDVLPERVEAITGTQVVDENIDAAGGFLDTFQNVLLGFAGVALFVSAFFINNTFSIVVGQRIRELALMRAIAATPAQVLRSVMAEALFVGAIASVIGLGVGFVIATVMQAIFEAAGFGLPTGALELAPRTIVVALGVGFGVTALSAFAPARHAARTSPVEGMRDGFVPPQSSRSRRTTVAIGFSALGVLAIGAGLSSADTMRMVTLLVIGALGVFIGIAQLSPVVAVPLAGALGRPLAPLFRAAGRLAQANAVRNPERTAKTASALMIGLALVTMVFIVGESMKRTFSDSIEAAVSADYILSTEAFTGFSPALTETIADLPEIDAATGVRFNRFTIEGNQRDLVAVDSSAADQVVDIDVRAGSLADLDDQSIFLHEDPAEDLGLSVGDDVAVELASSGPLELRVAGTYADATYAGNYLVDLALFDRYYPASDLDVYTFARRAGGVAPADATQAIEAVLTDFPQVRLDDRAGFRADQEAQFDSVLIAINGLLGLAIVIALLGITNTLALSVLERTREIGLLRAVGMVPGQTGRMILAESVMVAIFGAVLGVAVGSAFGVVACLALPETVVATIAIPYPTIAVVVFAAALSGVAAGLLPARRAARLDVLRAIADR